MAHIRHLGIIVLILTGLVLISFSYGCNPENDNADGDTPAEEISPEDNAPPVEDQVVEEPETEDFWDETMGVREALTQTDLDALTMYGTLQIPDSWLEEDPSLSTHQAIADGTEIYRMTLGIEREVAEVVDWYRENLEPGTDERTGEIGGGIVMSNFTFSSVSPPYNKTITITGYPGEIRTKIVILINSREPEEEPEEVIEENPVG